MLDGSIVKVHQDATRSCLNKSDEAIGASVGGLSTKIHAKVDAFGQLLKILLSPGQAHESQFVFEAYDSEPCEFFLADKAYDIEAFRDHVRKDGVEAVIPSKKNRKRAQVHDEHIYRERNTVERFFQKIKRFRRIATRYEKTARMYMAGVMMVSILLAIGL